MRSRKAIISWMPRQRLRYRSNREFLAGRGERGVDILDAHCHTMRDLPPRELPCLARLAWTRWPQCHTLQRLCLSVCLVCPTHHTLGVPALGTRLTKPRVGSHFSSSCLCTKYTPMLFLLLRRAPSHASSARAISGSASFPLVVTPLFLPCLALPLARCAPRASCVAIRCWSRCSS